MGFEELVVKMAQRGFFQFYLPFAIYFLILIGIFLKYKPFGEWKDNKAMQLIYGILSFLIALYIMLYGLHVYIEMFLAWVFGRLGIVLMLILGALVLAAFAKGGVEGG